MTYNSRNRVLIDPETLPCLTAEQTSDVITLMRSGYSQIEAVVRVTEPKKKIRAPSWRDVK